MLKAVQAFVTVAAFVCAVLPQADAMRVFPNFNQFSRRMANETDRWREGLQNSDGFFATGAPNPTDPMSWIDMDRLMYRFGSKSKTMITKWGLLVGENRFHHETETLGDYLLRKQPAFVQSAPGVAAPLPSVFAFDDKGATLSTVQLDWLRDNGLPKVYINTRRWDTYGEDVVKASINHPWCAGVVIEGNPQALTLPAISRNQRLQIAQYVKNVGKPLRLLSPLTRPDASGMADHLGALAEMWDSLVAALGQDYMCHGDVGVVPSLYNDEDTPLEFLPETNPDGTIANTYAGGLLWLTRNKRRGCMQS